ncbi:MAG: septum formation initiator family protein [Patescibacteria group bacterium]
MRRRDTLGKTPRNWRTIVRLPAFLIVNAALLLVIGISTVRESYRGWSVDHEIHALEAQASTLEGQKIQLDALTKQLGSPDHIDYEARAKLGQKKPGERVVVLEGYETSATWTGQAGQDDTLLDAPTIEPKTNPERWWSYFFQRT